MCGIVGCAGKVTGLHERVVKTMLVLDTLRGEDSTGVAVVRRNGEVHVAKETGVPFNLFDTNRFTKAMAGNNKVVIGHNRFATQGGVSRRNAHPFEFDTLVGVHNGTLQSKWKLEDHADFKVDSENLFHHIEKKGIADAINQLGAPNNAWALVWWDKGTSELNMLRNDERPLYFARTLDGEVLFWASEAWMITVACVRSEVKIGDVVMLEKDLLHKVKINNNGDMEKPVVVRVEAPKVLAAPQQQQNTPFKGSGTGSSNSGQGDSQSKNVVEAGKKTAYDLQYMRVKGRQFETLSIVKDEHGNEYVSLFDELMPYSDIRMYVNQGMDELRAHVQQFGFIKADVSGFVMSGKGYYKVSPHSLVIVPLEEAPPVAKQEEDQKLYPTHRGLYVTKKAWEEEYAMCDYCTTLLVAGEANRFTSGGQCLCPACSTDQEVLKYVNLT